MASQFRDVLRDFALEKMKEIEKQDTSSRKGSSSSKSGREKKDAGDKTQTSDKDRDKTDLRALISSRLAAMAAEMKENESKEKKDLQKKHHKHSKREEHSRKSKKKDKKHSSSKHKRKHKKKSSHHRSGHHSKKDKTKKGSTVPEMEDHKHEAKETVVMEMKTDEADPSGSDTQNTDSEDNSMDSDSERSVSPPFQVGKEIENVDFEGQFSKSSSITQHADENVVAKEDGDACIEERSVSSRSSSEKNGGDEKDLLIKDNIDKNVKENILKSNLTSSERHFGSLEETIVSSLSHGPKESKQILGKNVDSRVEPSQISSKEKASDTSAMISQLNSKVAPIESINLLSASEVISSGSGMSKMDTQEKNNISKGNKASLSPKDGDDMPDACEVQNSNVKTESLPQKSQAKTKVIKINIKTQELPENTQKAAEEGNSDFMKAVDESEESEDEVEDKENSSGKPWRIVPEEGELTPSSSEDEDDKEEAGISEENKDIKEKRHKHRKHRKRKKNKRDGREEGEIVEKKKRKRDVPESDSANSKDKESSSVNDGDKKDEQKSSSPQRKSVKSSVSSVVKSQTVGGNPPKKSRSRSRTPRSPRSYSSRDYYHRSRSRSPRSRRSRSPRNHHNDKFDRGWRRSRSRERGRYRSRSGSKERSRSRDRRRYRSRSNSRERSWSRGRGRRRSRSFSKGHHRSKSPSVERKRRERSFTPVEEIDKKKLLEIAKANAYMYQRVLSGDLPASTKVVQTGNSTGSTQNERSTVKIAGRTVDELTEVCKGLSKKEGEDSSDEEPVNVPVTSDDDEEKDNFIRHPFQVKERPASIVVNIQNATPMPVLNSKETLRVQFPVSSGTQHRKKEDPNVPSPYGQWQPVQKPTAPPGGTPSLPASTVSAPAKQPPSSEQPPGMAAPSTTPPVTTPTAATLPNVATPSLPTAVPVEDRVFDETPTENVNIADVVAMRLKAARALQTNPLDVEALSTMHSAQRKLQTWINRDSKPGLFTGSTDANILTPQQLANPNRKHQAWAKKSTVSWDELKNEVALFRLALDLSHHTVDLPKDLQLDMFHNNTPVQGGIGMHLLQKMGWKQGEGLGKNKEGSTLPLMLDVKTDRKGLAAKDNKKKPRTLPFVNSVPLQMTLPGSTQQTQNPPQVKTDFAGKHPVSVLNELCSKRKWRQPEYTVVLDDGPAHKKEYIFKVILNNEEYQGATSCNNKKEAKALAAQTALVKMGLVPPD